MTDEKPRPSLIDAIRTAGLANQKGPRIQQVLREIMAERGNLDLSFLNDLPLEEARAWETRLPGFRFVPVLSDASPEDAWEGRTGYAHEALMADLPDLSGHEVYACGSPAIIDNARNALVQHCALPQEAFYSDAFSFSADSQPT